MDKSSVKLLIGADNPDGYKLEELLTMIEDEMIAKNRKIKDDKSAVAIMVQGNNLQIIKLLSHAQSL